MYSPLVIALFVVNKAIWVYQLLIIVRAILTWVPDLVYRHPEFMRFLERVTDPAIRPFRRILSPYKTGGLDLSPLLAIIALSIIGRVLNQLLVGVLR